MSIGIQNRRRGPNVPTRRLRQILRILCDGLGYKNPELSVVMTDDATIHGLNRLWRHRDKPTDVLSFSQVEGDGCKTGSSHEVLGDIVISTDTAWRQAQEAGHSLEYEIQRLLVHGILHLLGHDHVHGGLQARRMQAEERRLLDLVAHSLAPYNL